MLPEHLFEDGRILLPNLFGRDDLHEFPVCKYFAVKFIGRGQIVAEQRPSVMLFCLLLRMVQRQCPQVLRLLSGAFYYDTTRRNIRIGVMPIEVARCSSAEKPLGMRNVCPEIESR